MKTKKKKQKRENSAHLSPSASEKMPKIDTLDALDDEMTSILSTL